MFKVYGIIEISKIEFFNFSGAESVKGLSVAIILSGLRVRLWAFNLIQRQPSGGVLKKRCSENMQQNYRMTPMPKCDFKKVALLCNFIEIALRHGCSPANLRHIFRTPFLKNTSERLLLLITCKFLCVERKRMRTTWTKCFGSNHFLIRRKKKHFLFGVALKSNHYFFRHLLKIRH